MGATLARPGAEGEAHQDLTGQLRIVESGRPTSPNCAHVSSRTLPARPLAKRYALPPIAQDDDWAQMVAIPVPVADPERLRAELFHQHRIEVPVTRHAGQVFVRLSVQGYNTEEDVSRLVRALCSLDR